MKHEHFLREHSEVTAALEGCRHTKFILFKCECGHAVGFPSENVDLAISKGTEETRKMLRKMGLLKEKN